MKVRRRSKLERQMISFLAASTILISSAFEQKTAAEEPLWNRISRSVVSLQGPTSQTGVGALIDTRGWFVAYSGAVAGPSVTGVYLNRIITLKQIAVDKETQLVLLAATNWPKDSGSPIRVAPQSVKAGEKLLAVTTKWPIRAELTSDQRVAQLRPSMRYAPISEIHLEDTDAKAMGALAFNAKGELVGILGVTLGGEKDSAGAPGAANRGGSGFGGGGAGNAGNTAYDKKNAPEKLQNTFGPGALTVGYALGPSLLDRVINGFRTPDHTVHHPSIGVFFKRSDQVGASIEAVMPGSPAEQAGMRMGDLVVEAGGRRITDSVAFAVFLFDQKVGDTVELKIRRGDQDLTVKVKVGVQTVEDLN